ncbi:geranylgeranyl reductase [Desulfarculus baarsii DSM 2075]|uniref:Geranylgeranyl reductase n=1 Tax=Desulfarculus baarsii (strain ATCC 33931 / DSM 2075 / LMG 7858 / VKM B-1802 / 2st14) TaxID=644282 RepID=E1QJ30_DESB2|nr:FAD-dependent monooxygenase [Desulfarculus baarsii]ADK85573.1 geranylgeranyl reductase [Desulfarculus baarsii DSM 2075]
MSARYDIIVAGLGPGGAAAAMTLARAGARVLALDGSGGREKPCGGCLSLRGVLAVESLSPCPWLRDCPVATLWLSGPGLPAGRYPTSEAGVYFVERPRLDRWLAQEARQSGVAVLPAKLRAIEADGHGWRARTSAGDFEADWLIGADGAHSLVARGLGLGGGGWLYVGLVEERPMPPRLAPLLGGTALLELGGAPGGYGWAFGRGQTLNLGMAGRRELLGRMGGLRRCYGRFLRRLGLGEPGRLRGAVIPCPDGGVRRYYRGRAAVVGDAAGLADPFLGEGVAQAVVSGHMAARAIVAGDLGRYQRALAETLLRDHHNARRLSRLIYGWPRLALRAAAARPGAIELGWRILRGQTRPGDLWKVVPRRLVGLRHGLDHAAASYYSLASS